MLMPNKCSVVCCYSGYKNGLNNPCYKFPHDKGLSGKWLLVTWQDSGKLGLSKQTFKALIQTNYAISELSLDLLSEGYDYVLTVK